MPAVHTFSIFAAVAVAFNFLLQMTILLAVVTLDAKRQSRNRIDILCCIKADKNDEVVEECCPGGILYYIMKNIYAPTLMLYPIRVIVVSYCLCKHTTSEILIVQVLTTSREETEVRQ